MGGLGNNIFQINYGLYLRDVKGFEVIFVDYLTNENCTTKLLGWSVHDRCVKQLFPFLNIERRGSLIQPAVAKIPFLNKYANYVGVHKEMGCVTRNLFGYFQFGKEKIPLSQILELKEDPKVVNFVDKFDRTVHLRFRDNNWLKSSIEFYESQLKSFRSENILICTDDKESARRIALNSGVARFKISERGVLDDFKALAFSKNICLSPSSFSWWACSLNRRKINVRAPDTVRKEFGEFY
jgi:hypothetical protein